MVTVTPLSNPHARNIWWIALVTQVLVGFTNGLYVYMWGPYLYERLGGATKPEIAMFLTTILLGIRQGMVALLEVPTGALADAIGRAQTVVMSWVARAIFFSALTALWVCHSTSLSFTCAVIASLAFAISYTMFNGAFSSWCVEMLRERAPEVSYSWLVSRFHSYQMMGVCVGGALSVVLYVNHLAYAAFLLAAVLSFIAMGFAMTKMEEVTSLRFVSTEEAPIAAITKRMGEIIGRGAQVCIRKPVLFWIVLTFGAYMFLLNVVAYLWPVYLKERFGLENSFARNWILIIVAAQGLSFVGARLLVWINGFWSRRGGVATHLAGFRRLYVGICLLSAVSILLLSWDTAYHQFGGVFFPVAVLVVTFAYGIIAPCFETLINAYIPLENAQERATIMSAGSMFRSFMILILAVPAGGSSGATSPIGWAIPAPLLLVAALTANVLMRRAERVTVAPTIQTVTPPDNEDLESE